jgi:hypothetical protein
MPANVIERIHVLARVSPAGMHFTNMWNKAYAGDNAAGPGGESNDDSDSDSDDESSTGDDDHYDNFIAGVDMHDNSDDPPDPPDTNADDITNNNADDITNNDEADDVYEDDTI